MKKILAALLSFMVIASFSYAETSAMHSAEPNDGPLKSSQGAKLSGTIITFPANDEFGVYSGPSSYSYRTDGDAATVKTNNPIWCYGIDGGYALIRYQAEEKYHFGYIEEKWLTNPKETMELQLDSTPACVVRSTDVTDDPLGEVRSLLLLNAGDTVTYLAMLDDEWAHVELTRPDGLMMRGFVKISDLAM